MTEQPSPSRAVIACPECGKKLGVPADRGALRVACPACNHAFEWRPEDDAPLDVIVAEAAPGDAPGESDRLRFAARLVTGTLLGEMKRADGPGGAMQGSVDPDRVAGTSLLAGRKVFGEAYTRALVEEAVRWGAEDVRNCLERLAGETVFTRMKAACSDPQKDDLILAALTALELNIDNIGVELLKLRAFGHRLYDTPAESDRRMIMYGETGQALHPRAVELVNEIVRELNAGSGGTAARSGSDPKKEKPARDIGKGFSILIACALASIGMIKFGAQNVEDPPAWLALGGLVLSVFFYYWVYRGFRLMTGAGMWGSVALTVFGFPLLFGALLFLIGEVLPLFENGGNPVASLTPGGDAGAQDTGDGDYFTGLNANNTSAADLDELIENW